jgi:bacteriocin biosynthesis cyclodehydratase domain-containing protein
VCGGGIVAVSLLRLLHDAGVGDLGEARGTGPDHRGDPDLTVLVDDHEPATDVLDRLMRAGLPHLVAGMRGDTGVVGPLVLPGATPCLRCVDLTRRQQDRQWAGVREQLSHPERPVVPAPTPAVVTTAVAALAASDVLARLEGRTAATTGATASLTLAAPLPSMRRWPVQPACGCAWHTFSAAEAAQGQWTA